MMLLQRLSLVIVILLSLLWTGYGRIIQPFAGVKDINIAVNTTATTTNSDGLVRIASGQMVTHVVRRTMVGGILSFTTLSCNVNLTSAPCQSWTSKYGTTNVHTTLIIVPCGTCIIMDFNQSNPTVDSSLFLLGGIDIHGKLVFPDKGDSGTKISITTTMMIVQGELSMTSTAKPINGQPNIHITLIGQDVNQTFTPVDNNAMACSITTTPSPCKIGKKAIVVAGGTVKVHGIEMHTKSWTRLYDVVGFNYTHPDTIYLENFNVQGRWVAGAEVVITSHTRSPGHTQVRTIVAVSDAPVSGYSAYKLNAPILRPTTIVESPDMAVEVALLSRNILFEGGPDTTTYHGGHFMIFHTPTIVQVIEGVEIKNFGQQGLLGRYPIHFHYSDDVTGSIVRKNSIRQSNQRCVVVHGTNNLLIEENVAFDTKGHCYMTEDGIETDNAFVRNLGALTGIPERLIPNSTEFNNGVETDKAPATFWITNPDNIFLGNVAAGSYDSGFWFEPKVRGVRAPLYEGYDPRIIPMRVFIDNVVHSCAGGAIRTYTPGYRPSDIVILDGLKCYRNTRIGIQIHRSPNITIANSFFADNIVSIDIDRTVGVEVINTTIVGESDSYRSLYNRNRNLLKMCDAGGKRVGIELHLWTVERNWTGAKISNVTFLGFNKTAECSKAASIKYDTENLKQSVFEFYTSFQGMRISDGPSSVDFCVVNEGETDMVYAIDLDGSMKPDSTIQTTGASTLVGLDDGRLLEFVDTSKYTKIEAGCYCYCPDTCFRSMRFLVDVPQRQAYSLKVCLREDHSKCTTFDGGRRSENDKYTIVAHLPVGNTYNAIFVSSTGSEVSPQFQQDAEIFFCAGDSVFDVAIVNGGITTGPPAGEGTPNDDPEETLPPTTGDTTIVRTFIQRFIGLMKRILQFFNDVI